jgi:RNA:NAD 2'-phosphotransferase (TPT1/KptA family)
VGIAPFWRLLFSVPNRSAPNIFLTVNVEAPLRDGVKFFQAKRDVSTSVRIVGLNLMEKKNPLKKVIPHPATGH